MAAGYSNEMRKQLQMYMEEDCDSLQLLESLKKTSADVRYNLLMDVRCGTNNLWTGLHSAALKGHTEVVEHVLNGVTQQQRFHLVCLQDKDNWTALHLAVKYGSMEMVHHLLEELTPQQRFQLLALKTTKGDNTLHIASIAMNSEKILTLLSLCPPQHQRQLLTMPKSIVKKLTGQIPEMLCAAADSIRSARDQLQQKDTQLQQKDTQLQQIQTELQESKDKIQELEAQMKRLIQTPIDTSAVENQEYAPSKDQLQQKDTQLQETQTLLHQTQTELQQTETELQQINTKQPEPKVVTALYDFQARTDEDPTFRRGDRVIIINDSDQDWWYAEHTSTHLQGYIPNNYVAVESFLQSFDWFMKIQYKEAERLLLNEMNPFGTFLIRNSETVEGTYSLSVKTNDLNRGSTVKHYRIRNLDNGGFYISTRIKFKTLEQLVKHYLTTADGLCCRLSKMCPADAPVLKELSQDPKDDWGIPCSFLHLKQKLSAGQFGEVWKGKWNNTTAVAVKTFKPGTMSSQVFLNEVEIMRKCRHNKLLQLFAICSLEEPIYIITEWMCNGALLQYLREHNEEILLSQLIDIGAQVASGMSYLETEHYIHRDLAARNVLVGRNNIVKVAGFSMARLTQDDQYISPQGSKFSLKWTAPEAAIMSKFTIKSDVWSFGILMVEIITHGQTPYPGMANCEVLDLIDQGYRHPKPEGCPDELYELMNQCWDKDPQNRLTFEYLHGFLDDFFISTENKLTAVTQVPSLGNLVRSS